MEWEGAGERTAAGTALLAGAAGGADADVVLALGQSGGGALEAEQVLKQLDDQPLVPVRLEASMLAAPAAWPVAATVQQLAGTSALAGARRDVALLRYILGVCAAAAAAGLGAGSPSGAEAAARQRVWTSRLQAALRDASGAVRDAAVRLLQYMPSEVVAPVLHGGAANGEALAGFDDPAGPVAAAAAAGVCLHLQQLAWAVAQCLAQRACPLDSGYRQLLCGWTSADTNSMAAALQVSPETAAGGLGQEMAALVSELVSSVVSHPLSERLRQGTCTAAQTGGMPPELQRLQPLDLRYSHLLQPYLPGVPAAEWATLMCSAARLRCAQASLAARLLLGHVTAGADAAVASSAASPLQVSYWRFLRPEERAATDAEHPVVDCLYPLLSAVADLEDLLLLQPLGPSDGSWGPGLTGLVATVQAWRSSLWRVVHGVLHLPLAVQSYTAVDGGQAVTVAPLRLDVPQLTWTWMRTDKALAALLALPDVGASLAADGGALAARLDYVRAQTREALGLAARPAKPLAWALCGKPVLPSTLQLLESLVRGRALAAAAAAVALDPQGRPMGLQAAGVDLEAVIAAAAAAAGGPAQELIDDDSQDVRRQVAEAVTLTLCVDPTLRRALSQGLAMLGAMPLLEALRQPGDGRQRRRGGAAADGSGAALAAQGAGVVSTMQESLQARVTEAAARVLACPSEDEWMMRQGMQEARAEPAAAVAAVAEVKGQQQQQPLLLPSAWMASRTCRQLQLPLLALQDCLSLRRQAGLLAAAAGAAALWPVGLLHAAAAPAEGRAATVAAAAAAAAPRLARAARAAAEMATRSSSRSTADLAPCLQLQWVLDELDEYDKNNQRQGPASAGAGGLDARQLCQVVVPALAHEMWLTWHAANWRNAFSSGLGAAATAAVGAAGAAQPAGGPATVLDAPLLSACALRVLRSSESQVQSKAMRLRQLRAALATLLQSPGAAASDGDTRSERAAAGGPPPAAEWAGITYLLCQVLLAHEGSLPSEDLRGMLRDLCGRLAATASAAAAAGGAELPAPDSTEELCGKLAFVLEHSNHSTLRELLRPVALPAVAAVVDGLCQRPKAAASAAGAVGTSAQRVLYCAAQQRAARDAELALRGRAWLLVGLLRLQLVVPPPGIDPAGKYALKRRHLEGRVVHELQPEILVRKALQGLPGGPSEAPHLAELQQHRADLVAQAEAAASRCVPRPQPCQYPALQEGAAAFAASLAAPPRVLALLEALSRAAAARHDRGAQHHQHQQHQQPSAVHAAAAAAAAALQESELWQANARAWTERFGLQYERYPDLVQPVNLAVQEMLRGLALLSSAASPGGSAAAGIGAASGAHVPHEQLGPVGAAAAGLLRFPAAAPQAAADPASATQLPSVLQPRMLAEPQPLQLVQQVARTAALQAAHVRQIQGQPLDPAKVAQAADLAGYEVQLRATRVALHALAREALARGRAAAAAAAAAASGGGSGAAAQREHAGAEQEDAALPALERLLAALVEQWAALKAFEEAAAEEEAQQFKTKTSTASFMNEDQETEATYRLAFPDHYAPFRDVAPLEPEEERREEEEREAEAAAGTGREGDADGTATAATARSSAARQLLDGELLTDVVRLHAAVYGALAAGAPPAPQAEDADAEPGVTGRPKAGPLAGVTGGAAGDVEESFRRSYELGAELLAAVGHGSLSSDVDDAAGLGHLFRLCLEHNALNRAAAVTSAEAVAGAGRRGGAAAGGSASRRRGTVILSGDEEDSGVDIQKACVEEISLLQEPVSAMESRLRGLLEEYPENPLLVQLRAIALRVLAMPLQSPLKTALTGLELLLSRAQVWEETAASFVSLKAQLGPLAALATRWRRLELSSWKGLLRRVAARHAAGAHRSWFHIHRLLAPTALLADAGADAAASTDSAAAALAASGVPVLIGMASVPSLMTGAAAADGSTAAAATTTGGPTGLSPELELTYRRVASTLESFVQTSTLGEFRARLAMLSAFASHVDVRRQQPGGAGPLAGPLAAALRNMVRYYGQFVGVVDAALAEGMAPLEKDLQDFVQLAKWDDRGYYALRAATEKAQRYLHRLSRRAEEVLCQPAATALATADKGMGVGELAAAAAVATRESDGAEPTTATAVVTNPADGPTKTAGDGKQQQQRPLPAAKAAKPKKLTPEQAAAEAEAMDLAGESSAAPATAAAGDTAAQWARVSAQLQAAFPLDAASQQALAAAVAALPIAGSGGSAGGGGGVSSAYLPRLPQLVNRMTRVIGDSLSPASGGGAADGDADGAPEAMTPDELTMTAIVRAHELRTDVSKGARMRKRQALAELFEALEQQGLSRRQTGVPPYDRDVAAWFKHPLPAPEALWQASGACPGSAPAASWSRADDYYYRAVARLQKLWRGSQQPHRDLTLQEVSTARRLCEHALYVTRRQRRALGDAAAVVAALVKLSDWMSEARPSAASASAPVSAPAGAAGDPAAAASASGAGASGTAPQGGLGPKDRLPALHRQKDCLDELALLGSETCQLLDACVTAWALPAAQAQLAAAAAAARAATATVAACKRRLDAALQDCAVRVASVGGGDGAQCLVWVTRGSVEAAQLNCQALAKTEAELAEAVRAAVAAADAGTGMDEVPALPALYRAVASAASAAAEWQDAPASAPQAQGSDAAAAAAGDLLPGEFVASLEALVRGVLLWAQPPQQQTQPVGAVEGGAASTGPAQLGGGLVGTTCELEATLKLCRARELACTAMAVLRQLPTVSASAAAASSAAAGPHAAGLLLGAVAPLLRMAAEALRLRALQLLTVHRSTSKLSYVCTAILATLVEEGYCVPEEGKEVEGGDGPGEFKEAEGTGLGEGTGAKDISDQLENQDQLLGAQQRGAQPEPQEEPDKQQGGPEEENKGIEMDDDFEGALQDVPTDERDRNRDSDDEEGDDERIDQQMGDVGDNEEVVDERLWNDEDDKDGKQDEQKKKKEEKYEKDAPIQVEDKTDLEYAPGQQEEQQDGPAKEPPKKEQKKGPEADGSQPEADEEGDEDGPVNEDTDDKYEDRHHAAPQAAEEELELPEEMNLDGDADGEGADPEKEEEQQRGEEQEQEAGREDGAAKEEDAEMATGEDDKEQPGPQEGGKEGEEDGEGGGEEQPGGEDAEMEDQNPEGGPGGIGEVDPEQQQQQPPEPEPEQPPDAVAVDQPTKDEEDQQQLQQQQQQAGPRGVESGAPTEQPESTGAAHGAPQEQQPLRPSDGDAAGRRPQPAPQRGPEEQQQLDPSNAPDSAPDAHQANMGLASSGERGAPAPITGGDRDPGSQQQRQQQQQRGRRQQQEPNPLRNLGDALERWRADLAVQHEAKPAAEEEDAAGVGEEGDPQDEGAPPANAEFQFLGAEERSRAGDTQALAPATEEQAAQQAEELDESGLMQQRRDEQQDAQADAGEDGPVAMEEDKPEPDGGDGSTEQQHRAALVSGQLPRTWGGRQRQGKLAGEDAEGDQEGEKEEEKRPTADELLKRELAEGEGAGEGDDLEPSRVVARLANATLMDHEDGAAAMAAEPARVPPGGLTPEQVEALRQQLDERLRGAAGAAAEADVAYGGEIWSRCEALVSGLAGELTEQLRLILEPTLASKLAGDYRTGKRISMKKVIGYIASHFRRDKIWLRRNRPDKRRYQVLLACDDSRSMAENGCGGFALEALALICKAMSRLEVGQVGVLKFGGGEGVVPLHPLDAPFNDNVGPSLAARLTFRQDNTIADRPMVQLMASLDHMLAAARHSCGAGGIGAGTQDLAQLVLILADGRFHEKESLHAAVREAAAKRGVCLAFIVLDNPSNSLLDMQSVSFAAGKPVFTKYLDSFPFPYYIVLRDIASLPATLADLLRQWFELSTA